MRIHFIRERMRLICGRMRLICARMRFIHPCIRRMVAPSVEIRVPNLVVECVYGLDAHEKGKNGLPNSAMDAAL